MFLYEEIIGIKKNDYISDFSDLSYCNKILLIPELINQILKKADQEIKFEIDWGRSKFVNGYAISKDRHSFINRRGVIKELPDNIVIISDFSEGKAAITVSSGKGFSYAILDGVTGTYQLLPSNIRPKDYAFSEGLIVCSTDYGRCTYVNVNGEVEAPDVYAFASSFVGGKAIVKAQGGNFKIINRQFKTIASLKNTPHVLCKKMIELYDKDLSHFVEDNIIRPRALGYNDCFYDKEFGVPLFLYIIIDKICEKFGFTLKSVNPKEQLTEVLSLLAEKGTYMFDCRTLEINECEVFRGIKVISERGSIISFDSEDYELMKSRARLKDE